MSSTSNLLPFLAVLLVLIGFVAMRTELGLSAEDAFESPRRLHVDDESCPVCSQPLPCNCDCYPEGSEHHSHSCGSAHHQHDDWQYEHSQGSTDN